MSGTSMDGVDAALIRSDGRYSIEAGPSDTFPYEPVFRARLREALGGRGPVHEVERDLTLHHVAAVQALRSEQGLQPGEIDLIGFHGHTIFHDPDHGRTWQIGDGGLLARETGIDVVSDFRARDVAAGGQGAPFAPLYHAALAAGLEKPLAVLNLGGVGNVTWIGTGRDEILAFDTGPGNALIDDWVARLGLGECDLDGRLAARGRVADAILGRLLDHPYFRRSPPKSLDRDAFDVGLLEDLSAEDGAATLAAFTAAAVAIAAEHFPAAARRWLVCGGGRRNPVLLDQLARRLGAPVCPVESVGWLGDALEAQAFAWLAKRSTLGLPLSVPATTGVPSPTTGGVLHRYAG